MTTTLRVLVGPCAMKATLRAMFKVAPLPVLTTAAWLQLVSECGGSEQRAGALLLKLAGKHNKPVAVNLPRPGGESTTAFLGPPGWSEERLRGWVGGLHAELQAEFGVVAAVRRVGGAKAAQSGGRA